jgi:hypothetical protein
MERIIPPCQSARFGVLENFWRFFGLVGSLQRSLFALGFLALMR